MSQKWRVCPLCRGEGTVVARHSRVWTQDDRDQDPDGFESMMAGHYDETCERCQGRRVVNGTTEREYHEEEQDRRTMLMEDGIYPGHPDHY